MFTDCFLTFKCMRCGSRGLFCNAHFLSSSPHKLVHSKHLINVYCRNLFWTVWKSRGEHCLTQRWSRHLELGNKSHLHGWLLWRPKCLEERDLKLSYKELIEDIICLIKEEMAAHEKTKQAIKKNCPAFTSCMYQISGCNIKIIIICWNEINKYLNQYTLSLITYISYPSTILV